jgi:hypothetical protein
MTLPDTGTLDDPFVGCIQDFFKVFIGKCLRGDCAAYGKYAASFALYHLGMLPFGGMIGLRYGIFFDCDKRRSYCIGYGLG